MSMTKFVRLLSLSCAKSTGEESKGGKKQWCQKKSKKESSDILLEGTKEYFVVNALAPAPLPGRGRGADGSSGNVVTLDDGSDDEEASSSSSLVSSGANADTTTQLSNAAISGLMNQKSDTDVAKGTLCDSHRMTLAEPLGDTVHAERGLLIVVLSLIRNGKKRLSWLLLS